MYVIISAKIKIALLEFYNCILYTMKQILMEWIIIMKIVQLEYFCTATRLHSITKAAAELYVTQPAISTAIKELEKEFSINLFNRTKNRLSLTKEGEIFYQKALKLLSEYNDTMDEFHDLGKDVTTLKIGIPPLLSTIFFPDMLIEFQKKYPDIPFELFEYGSIRAANMVMDGKLDLALVNMHFYEIDKLNSHTLMTDKIVFCVSKEHPLAKCHEVTMDMIKDESLIMYNTDSVQNETLDAAFKRIGAAPHTILHASQLYTIKNFICNNLGGAFLYSSLLRNLPGVTGLPISPAITQDIGLIWKKGSYTTDSTSKFIDFVKSQKY